MLSALFYTLILLVLRVHSQYSGFENLASFEPKMYTGIRCVFSPNMWISVLLMWSCGEKKEGNSLANNVTWLDFLSPLKTCRCLIFMCFLARQEEEFNWLLREEVHAVLKQLQDVLKVKPEVWHLQLDVTPSVRYCRVNRFWSSCVSFWQRTKNKAELLHVFDRYYHQFDFCVILTPMCTNKSVIAFVIRYSPFNLPFSQIDHCREWSSAARCPGTHRDTLCVPVIYKQRKASTASFFICSVKVDCNVSNTVTLKKLLHFADGWKNEKRTGPKLNCSGLRLCTYCC